MAKVFAPNKNYNGVSASISFVNGVGECSDPYLLKWFIDNGYEVEETEDILDEVGKDESGEDGKVDGKTFKSGKKDSKK